MVIVIGTATEWVNCYIVVVSGAATEWVNWYMVVGTGFVMSCQPHSGTSGPRRRKWNSGALLAATLKVLRALTDVSLKTYKMCKYFHLPASSGCSFQMTDQPPWNSATCGLESRAVVVDRLMRMEKQTRKSVRLNYNMWSSKTGDLWWAGSLTLKYTKEPPKPKTSPKNGLKCRVPKLLTRVVMHQKLRCKNTEMNKQDNLCNNHIRDSSNRIAS